MRIDETNFHLPLESKQQQYSIASTNAFNFQLSRQGRAADLQELINTHGDVVSQCVNQRDNSELAALHYAARNGQLNCVKLLVEHGGAGERKDVPHNHNI